MIFFFYDLFIENQQKLGILTGHVTVAELEPATTRPSTVFPRDGLARNANRFIHHVTEGLFVSYHIASYIFLKKYSITQHHIQKNITKTSWQILNSNDFSHYKE